MLSLNSSFFFFIAEEAKNDEIPILVCCQDKDHKRDTVFNVALTVGSHLEEIVEKVKSRHGIDHILVPIIPTIDCRISVIKSCCGNIIHTLLDRKSSLNGFEKVIYSFSYRTFKLCMEVYDKINVSRFSITFLSSHYTFY